MIVSHRCLHQPRFGVSVESHYLFNSRFRITLWEQHGSIVDNSLFFPKTARTTTSDQRIKRRTERSLVYVVLSGSSRSFEVDGRRDLGPGEALIQNQHDGRPVRQQGIQLMLEWDGGDLGGHIDETSVHAFPEKDRLRLLAAAMELRALPEEGPGGLRVTREIFEILRSNGIPLEKVEEADLDEAIDANLLRVNRAVSEAFSTRMSSGLTIVDLQTMTGLSRRHFQRLHAEYLKLGHFLYTSGWREALRRWRLYTGLALMSSEQATTDAVAEVLGYSSPEAFCRAFADEGLPSPGNIRRAIDPI